MEERVFAHESVLFFQRHAADLKAIWQIHFHPHLGSLEEATSRTGEKCIRRLYWNHVCASAHQHVCTQVSASTTAMNSMYVQYLMATAL